MAFNVLYCLKVYRFVFLYVSTFAWPLKLQIILKLLVVYMKIRTRHVRQVKKK